MNTVKEIGIVGTNKDDETLRALENIFGQRSENYIILKFDEYDYESSPSYDEVINTLSKVGRLIICFGEESTDMGFVLNKALSLELNTCALIKTDKKIDPIIEKYRTKTCRSLNIRK